MKNMENNTLTGWICTQCGCSNSPFVNQCQNKCHLKFWEEVKKHHQTTTINEIGIDEYFLNK